MTDRHKFTANAPAEYEAADMYAVAAVAEGTATPDQQIRAMQWIELVACAVEQPSYFSDAEGGDRAGNFMEGRRFVGNTIRKMRNPITREAQRVKSEKSNPSSREAKSDERT